MENGYGYGQDYGYGYGYGYGHGHGHGLYSEGSGVWRSLRDGDFEEEDVWAVLKERKESNRCKVTQSNFEAQNSVKRSLPSAARMIPRASVGGSSSGSGSSISNHHMSESTRGGVKQQSAPVSIPDWSKINGKKSNKSFKVHDYEDDDDDDDDDEYDDDDDGINDASDSDENEDEDMYNDKMPPHELIARRLARSQISSFSVFEGVGRTLKGRDLSKVRNAILTKTGFLE